jgi:hypothetical protein
MITPRHLVRAIALTALVFAASPAGASDLRPAFVSSPSGTLHIEQQIPCGGLVVQSTPVTAGYIEISPAEGLDVTGGKQFVLTRVNLSFAPFSATGSCLLFSETHNYTEVGVELAQAVSFVGTPAGGGVYNVTIPRSLVWLNEASIVNGEPENGTRQPRDDVTATIDLTRGIATMHVVVANSVHFQACALGICPINEDDPGTFTADISGPLVFPDTDLDGVPDRRDNCTLVPNPDQTPVPTPVITPPPTIKLKSCVGEIGKATAIDVCDRGPVTIDNNAPAAFSVGPNLVTWTAIDAHGRTATATQTVNVFDATPPTFTFVPLDVTLSNCGPVSLGTATAVDDCKGIPTIANDAPASFGPGATTVTWTAKDASGNVATATQTVTVNDTVPPVVSCTPVSGPPSHVFRVFSSDACGMVTIKLGAFVLAEGEEIKIQETGRPDVRFVDRVGPDHIRLFQVPRGAAVVTAADAAGNTASAVCR